VRIISGPTAACRRMPEWSVSRRLKKWFKTEAFKQVGGKYGGAGAAEGPRNGMRVSLLDVGAAVCGAWRRAEARDKRCFLLATSRLRGVGVMSPEPLAGPGIGHGSRPRSGMGLRKSVKVPDGTARSTSKSAIEKRGSRTALERESRRPILSSCDVRHYRLNIWNMPYCSAAISGGP
jgi:hypothetical protein